MRGMRAAVGGVVVMLLVACGGGSDTPSKAAWTAKHGPALDALDADLQAALTQEAPAFPHRHKAGVLTKLAGVGPITATALVAEVFHRRFQSRRHLASYLGLAPTPFASGESGRDQGISKAGNQPARSILVELAWGWLRYQPGSRLTSWYQQTFAGRGQRGRKVGIVALARKLAIALWRLAPGMKPRWKRNS